jgi:hypothetical protein
MPSKKPRPPFDATHIAKSRALIADSLLNDGPALSKPYPVSPTNSAKVVSVLTERGGAEACEYVLPQTAKAIVAAFGPGGWGAALDEIERLRALVADATSSIEDASFYRKDHDAFMKVAIRIRRKARL